MRVFVVAAALVLAGCESMVPPAPKGLTPPAAWMLQRCAPLPPVPERDGNPAVRREHSIETRGLYVECAHRQAALAGYARNVSRK